MKWMKVSMSADDVQTGRPMQLQESFEAAFLAAKGPKETAFLGRYCTPTAPPNAMRHSDPERHLYALETMRIGTCSCHARRSFHFGTNLQV
jgi:hypothetical protein